MQKRIPVSLLFLAAFLLMGGCASLESAYYADREFGEASQASWDLHVLYPDYRYADKIPEGTSGIIAEEIMDVHINTYKEEPTKVNVFQLGIEE